jgi:hypothetical protein
MGANDLAALHPIRLIVMIKSLIGFGPLAPELFAKVFVNEEMVSK